MELSGNDEAATRCLMGCPKSVVVENRGLKASVDRTSNGLGTGSPGQVKRDLL